MKDLGKSVKRIPFNIDYPVKIFKNKKVNFQNSLERNKIISRNIYYKLLHGKENSLLKERAKDYFKIALELEKKIIEKKRISKILSISVFGSSLYTKNNKDFDFLVIISGNFFSYEEMKMKIGEKKIKVGVSIKGVENLSKGLCDLNSQTPLNFQSQILYRTTISLFRRHVPLIGYDFKNNRGLFYKNLYPLVCDLLYNTYEKYYLPHKFIRMNSEKRAQKILSRLFEALTYLKIKSKKTKFNFFKEKILKLKNKKISLTEGQKIFDEVLTIYHEQIKDLLETKRNNKEVLSILSYGKVKQNIISRLENYWKIAKLPFYWISQIIEILSENQKKEDISIEKVRREYPQILDPKSKEYSYKLREFRVIKVFNLAKRISKHIKGKILIDIGGRSDDFAAEIVKQEKRIKKIYVTDLSSYTKRSSNKKIDFFVQPSATNIPFKENSIDTALLIMVLHHLKGNDRKKMIKSIKKLLKRKGRIILVEDTFPEEIKDLKNLSKNTLEFLEFNNKLKKKILYFYDWFGNRLMRSRDTIPLYHDYKSMEEWKKFFEKQGMKCKHSEFIKASEKNPDIFPPKAILVFEK